MNMPRLDGPDTVTAAMTSSAGPGGAGGGKTTGPSGQGTGPGLGKGYHILLLEGQGYIFLCQSYVRKEGSREGSPSLDLILYEPLTPKFKKLGNKN